MLMHKMHRMSPAEKRLIREQSGMEPTADNLMRLGVILLALVLGTLLALHFAYLTVTNGGTLYAAY